MGRREFIKYSLGKIWQTILNLDRALYDDFTKYREFTEPMIQRIESYFVKEEYSNFRWNEDSQCWIYTHPKDKEPLQISHLIARLEDQQIREDFFSLNPNYDFTDPNTDEVLQAGQSLNLPGIRS